MYGRDKSYTYLGGGGFRPFMNDRMPGPGGNRPWFDGGPPSVGSSQNPFLNPSQNPFAAGGNPFMPNSENPFEVDGPPNRRPGKGRGDRGDFLRVRVMGLVLIPSVVVGIEMVHRTGLGVDGVGLQCVDEDVEEDGASLNLIIVS